jgi:hypothetical protein
VCGPKHFSTTLQDCLLRKRNGNLGFAGEAQVVREEQGELGTGGSFKVAVGAASEEKVPESDSWPIGIYSIVDDLYMVLPMCRIARHLLRTTLYGMSLHNRYVLCTEHNIGRYACNSVGPVSFI